MEPNRSFPPSSQYRQHPKFFQDVESRIVVFLVEDTLFRVNVAQITVGSEGLKVMFGIDNLTDEGTPENPIMIPATISQFEGFLEFINHLNWQPMPLKDHLLGILHMCSLWIIPDGIQFAVNGLNVHDISPSHRLQLGGQYCIRSWLVTSTTSLLEMPLGDWTAEDLDRVPARLFVAIAKAREAIENERKLIAARPPSLLWRHHSDMCPSNSRCTDAWNEGWWKVMAREILHPAKHLRIRDIPEHLRETVVDGMAKECKNLIIADLAMSDALQFEEVIKRRVVEAVVQHFGLRVGDPTMEF